MTAARLIAALSVTACRDVMGRNGRHVTGVVVQLESTAKKRAALLTNTARDACNESEPNVRPGLPAAEPIAGAEQSQAEQRQRRGLRPPVAARPPPVVATGRPPPVVPPRLYEAMCDR